MIFFGLGVFFILLVALFGESVIIVGSVVGVVVVFGFLLGVLVLEFIENINFIFIFIIIKLIVNDIFSIIYYSMLIVLF